MGGKGAARQANGTLGTRVSGSDTSRNAHLVLVLPVAPHAWRRGLLHKFVYSPLAVFLVSDELEALDGGKVFALLVQEGQAGGTPLSFGQRLELRQLLQAPLLQAVVEQIKVVDRPGVEASLKVTLLLALAALLSLGRLLCVPRIARRLGGLQAGHVTAGVPSSEILLDDDNLSRGVLKEAEMGHSKKARGQVQSDALVCDS